MKVVGIAFLILMPALAVFLNNIEWVKICALYHCLGILLLGLDEFRKSK